MKKLLLPKSYYLEFAAATLLYIVNVLLTLFFPYFTAHKAYYDSTAYITVLTTAYLIYVIRIHLTAKKSASDIAVVLFTFFILWELSYKLGLIHNDLLIPSPEGLFHVFVEKPAEIGAGRTWFPAASVLGLPSGSRIRHNFRTSCRLDSESKRSAASLIQCDYTDSAVNVFSVSDYDFFHLPSGCDCRNLLRRVLADLSGNGGKSGTD